MKTLLLFLIFFFTSFSFGQNVSCEELMDYVRQNGRETGNVSSITLYDSSWLKDVTAYSINNKIVVIAEFKRDEYGINTKKYIFCGIPSTNWDNFYYGFYDSGKSYGERFHKYIFDYQCSCN